MSCTFIHLLLHLSQYQYKRLIEAFPFTQTTS